MVEMNKVLAAKPGTVFEDKYGGADFTVEELAEFAVSMMRTDTKEDCDNFFERFVPKASR